MAAKLATGPTVAYGFIKQLARAADKSSLPEQMQLESERQARVRTTEDAGEARRAFADKRPPVFKGK